MLDSRFRSSKKKTWLWGGSLAVVAVIVAVTSGGSEVDSDAARAAAPEGPGMQMASYGGEQQDHSRYQQDSSSIPSGYEDFETAHGETEQTLEGLAGIRQQQCQMGNQLACQAMGSFPKIRSELAQAKRSCRAGASAGCDGYKALSQKILTAYSESAAVMRAGEQGMAQMNAWRAQMNRNADASMANLQALGARGQAAHQARQESYAAQTRAYNAQQDSIDRQHGQRIDRVYEGTTMQGGGVESRIADGSVGYTDGYGNVIAVPEGQRAPDGWQEMAPKYQAPR